MNIVEPFISVVTPSFNQVSYINAAIESVKAQHYQHYEHIVIDGMSTDGTVDVLREKGSGAPSFKWISEKDDGQSSALNKGFRMAQGDIVGWLNSDDFYRSGCFERVVEIFKKNPDVDIVYGDYDFVDDNGDLITHRRETEFSRFTLFYHHVLYIATITTFFRRRVFDEGNWIDEDLHYAMDLDLLIRLARKGYVIKHIDSMLAGYRLHPESKTCSSPAMFKAEHFEVARASILLNHNFRSQWMANAIIWFGRFPAAFIRYAEKWLRGYYWPGWGAKCGY